MFIIKAIIAITAAAPILLSFSPIAKSIPTAIPIRPHRAASQTNPIEMKAIIERNLFLMTVTIIEIKAQKEMITASVMNARAALIFEHKLPRI